MTKAGRDRRVVARGKFLGADRSLRSYDNWNKTLKSFRRSNGWTGWIYQRPALIRKGGKP